jgi:hypothetical protein
MDVDLEQRTAVALLPLEGGITGSPVRMQISQIQQKY